MQVLLRVCGAFIPVRSHDSTADSPEVFGQIATSLIVFGFAARLAIPHNQPFKRCPETDAMKDGGDKSSSDGALTIMVTSPQELRGSAGGRCLLRRCRYCSPTSDLVPEYDGISFRV